ncbi:MAG: S41 family peptidase [Cyanobacteria bacterium J06649_4]
MEQDAVTQLLQDNTVGKTMAKKKSQTAQKKSSNTQKKDLATKAPEKKASEKKAPEKKASEKKKLEKKGPAKTDINETLRAPGLEFLENAHPAVRSQLAAAIQLPEFLDTVGKLTLKHRQQIVEQALVIMQDNFVHLPLKQAMHGVDPLQKLRLIQHRLEQSTPDTMGNEFQFHRDMIEVFTSVRDLHTNYLLPAPFANKIAFLPFDIEECFVKGEPQYIASHFVQGFTHEYFKRGVTITTWNGVPIERAIEISANYHAGSNASARHAQGIDGLTIRGLRRSLPPDAMWVIVGYVDLDGTEREYKQPWIVTALTPSTGEVDANEVSLNAASLGTDLQADIIQQARKMLFAPAVIAKEKAEAEKKKKNSQKKDSNRKAEPGEPLETRLDGVFRANSVNTSSGEFGYIRIFSFNVRDPDEFIDEFIRLAALLPQKGLIVDVRGNGGGHIYASEGLLQVLTPGEITPEPTQFINTALNGRICDRHRDNPVGIDLSPWVDSIRNSVETGAIYSRGYPITPHEFANGRGQKYHGPVVLITDARCYSATDIFAAGFKDHNIGHILGVDGNTGAGGANVWEHGLLRELLRIPEPADRQTPYKNLPQGAGMRVAIRRTLRVGDQAGTPVEDLGVVPDFRHDLTRADLLEGNKDLINAAGKLLKKMPVRELSATVSRGKETLAVEVTTLGISRLDFYLDGRPVESLFVEDDTHSFELELPESDARILTMKGYEQEAHVADRRIVL